MSLFLSAAFVVALAHPDLGQRRMVAELSGKGLWQINCHCCMVNSSGEIVDLSELCHSSGNSPSHSDSISPPQSEANPSSPRPIEIKIEQSGEHMPRNQKRNF